MLNAIGIALSGLSASSQKIAAAASNIANADTIGSLDNPAQPPYTPMTVQQQAASDGTVTTTLTPKNPPFVPAYDPGSPFANQTGLVGVPNIDLGAEAVNIDVAKTAYRADLAVIKTTKEMEDALFRAFDSKA